MEAKRLNRYFQIALPALLFLVARLLEKLFLGCHDRRWQGGASAGHEWIVLLCESIIVTVVLVLWVRKGRKRRAFSLRTLVFALAAGLVLGLLAALVNGALGLSAAVTASLPGFLVLCVLGPVSEELVFRGFVLARCGAVFSVPVSIAVSSLLFAVSHGSMVQMAEAFLVGLAFGLMAVRTENVKSCCLAHAVANTVIWLFSLA